MEGLLQHSGVMRTVGVIAGDSQARDRALQLALAPSSRIVEVSSIQSLTVGRDSGLDLLLFSLPQRPRGLRERLRRLHTLRGVERLGIPFLRVGRAERGAPLRPLLALTESVITEPLLLALRLFPAVEPLEALYVSDTGYELILHQTGAGEARLQELREEAREQSRKRMELALHATLGGLVSRISLHVRAGDPSEELITYALMRHFDVLVLGPTFSSRRGRLAPPTVGERTLLTAPCDVAVASAS